MNLYNLFTFNSIFACTQYFQSGIIILVQNNHFFLQISVKKPVKSGSDPQKTTRKNIGKLQEERSLSF